MPLEVNLVNLLDVLQKVTDVDDLGVHLGVPKHRLDEFRQDFHKTGERKREMLQWWLDHAVYTTWQRVIHALRAMHKPKLADAVAEVSQRESLYEPFEEKSQKLEENLKKIESLDKKLQEVQQRSEHLEREWEKGEEEWNEYLRKWMKIEKEWEDLVESQQKQKAYLTLGITLLYQSDSESLRRLEEKAQKHIARSKELRRFYEGAIQHRNELQESERELEEWEKALREQVLELQKRIDQMEELGDKFLGEAKNCREQLEKSQRRLQACRKKMSECRNELTKLKRRLQKCKDKLIECEVSLKRCRDNY